MLSKPQKVNFAEAMKNRFSTASKSEMDKEKSKINWVPSTNDKEEFPDFVYKFSKRKSKKTVTETSEKPGSTNSSLPPIKLEAYIESPGSKKKKRNGSATPPPPAPKKPIIEVDPIPAALRETCLYEPPPSASSSTIHKEEMKATALAPMEGPLETLAPEIGKSPALSPAKPPPSPPASHYT